MIKKIFFFFFLFPIWTIAQVDPDLQIEHTLQKKIAILKSCSEKGAKGEEVFWQTKGKITYAIVNYTDAQNPVFRDLFIKQYQEILPVLTDMVKNQNENSSTLFVKMLIRHEKEYRKQLTAQQLALYTNKVTEMETKNPEMIDSFNSLFYSDSLLKLYESKF